jgi:hypothetical protein
MLFWVDDRRKMTVRLDATASLRHRYQNDIMGAGLAEGPASVLDPTKYTLRAENDRHSIIAYLICLKDTARSRAL